MLNDTASLASIFVRFDEKIAVCYYVLQKKIVGIGQKEWNEQETGVASHHKAVSHNIDGWMLVKAHLDSWPMNSNISVRLKFPLLIHGPNQIYRYPIQNSEV